MGPMGPWARVAAITERCTQDAHIHWEWKSMHKPCTCVPRQWQTQFLYPVVKLDFKSRLTNVITVIRCYEDFEVYWGL
jgi:hypothetical protein